VQIFLRKAAALQTSLLRASPRSGQVICANNSRTGDFYSSRISLQNGTDRA
jgi:hypothetical protein